MTYIPTTHSRTITCTGTFSLTVGTLNAPIGIVGPMGGSFTFLGAVPISGIFPPGTNFFAGTCSFTGRNVSGSDLTHVYFNLGISAFGLAGSASGGPLTAGTTSGSWTVTFDAIQVAQLSYSSGPYPTLVITDQPKSGGSISASITFNGVTASCSGTIGISYAVPIDFVTGHALGYAIQADMASQGYSSSSFSASISPTYIGQALTQPFTHTYTNAYSETWVVDLTSGISIVNSWTTAFGNHGGLEVDSSRSPTRQGTINGQVNTFNSSYPVAITKEWADPINLPGGYTAFNFGDTISLDTYTSRVYNWSASTGRTSGLIPQPSAVNNGQGLTCRINPASLASNHEENTIYFGSLPARLTPFNALTLWQDAKFVVDTCTATTGWSANVSLVGGFIQVDSVATAYKQYYGLDMSGYRYLELDIKPNSTSGGTLEVDCFTYANDAFPLKYNATLGASGSVTTIRIDLLGPVTAPIALFQPHVSDSLYGGFANSSVEGPGWGIDKLSQIGLAFPSSSGTYQVKEIRMVRDSAPRMTFVQSGQTYLENPTTGASYYKFALGDTDGKRSMNIGAVNASSIGSRLVGAGSGTFTDQANKINGFHAVINASSADLAAWYFSWNENNLAGGGAIYTGTTPTDYWIDRPLTVNPTQVQYQTQCISVFFPPNCGDTINGAGYGGPFCWYTLVFLRGRSTGVALDNLLAPIASHTVTQYELPTLTSTGSGTTNSAGRFITTTPYARTAYYQRAILAGVTPGTSTINCFEHQGDTLRLAYVSKPQTAAGGLPWIVESAQGQIHLVTILNGDVLYERANQTTPVNGWAVSNVVTSWGDVVSASMDIDPQLLRIHMLVTRLTAGIYNVYLLTSDSDGRDFTAGSLLVANALGASVTALNMSGMLYTWFEYNSGTSGPGKQKAKYSPGSGQAFGATFTFKDSSSSDIVLNDKGWCNVEEAKDYANALVWAPVLNGGTSPTVYRSYDNGKTWS